MATQMYARFAKLLENHQAAIPNDPDLHMQLVSRKIFDGKDGKKILESKQDYKARGFDSPDEADATVMCYSDVELKNEIEDSFVEVDESQGGYANLWAR